MTRFSLLLIRGGAIAALLLAPSAAMAQRNAAPPPAVSPEIVSDLQARAIRMESEMEQLTGQVEELRHQNQQLEAQVKSLQDDLSPRVMRLEQGANGGALPPLPEPSRAPAPALPVPPPQQASGVPEPIFDPNAPMSAPVAKQPDMSMPASSPPPNAPAAPAPLVTPTQSGDSGFNIRTDQFGKALPPDPNAPKAPVAQAPPPPAPAPRAAPNPGTVASAGLSAGAATVTLPQGTPKQQYDFAFDLLRKQDYAHAETALREFVKANPKDPLAGNAQYWLGESLYVRGDYQGAAVEFMSGYQQYPKSNKGPDDLLKLGMAMSHLNQTQGACTALGRIAKEYPDAPEQIRKTAQTERGKLKCT